MSSRPGHDLLLFRQLVLLCGDMFSPDSVAGQHQPIHRRAVRRAVPVQWDPEPHRYGFMNALKF